MFLFFSVIYLFSIFELSTSFLPALSLIILFSVTCPISGVRSDGCCYFLLFFLNQSTIIIMAMSTYHII